MIAANAAPPAVGWDFLRDKSDAELERYLDIVQLQIRGIAGADPAVQVALTLAMGRLQERERRAIAERVRRFDKGGAA